MIEKQVLQLEGNLYNNEGVTYVNLNNKGSNSLHSDAINIALFGSVAEKDLLGTYKYSTPTSGNKAMNEKPPLRVAIDTLLLFNFNDYLTALKSYDLVLAYFYNNDLLYVSDEGEKVQVLLSSFNDLDEIEIWSSFNTPGIPILRYELKYAIIPGRFDELPMIKTISTTEGILYPEEISTLILNEIYIPVNNILNKVLQKTTTFCSIAVPTTQEERDKLSVEKKTALQDDITRIYNELLKSYPTAEKEIDLYKEYLTQQIEEGKLSEKEFEPFLPSMSGLVLKTIEYQQVLEEITPTLDNYFEVCDKVKEKIEGEKGLPADFRFRLVLTTDYLNFIDILDKDIIAFDTIGGSCYIPKGNKPYSTFQEVTGISTMQWRKKWWEIESKMTQLNIDYLETASNELFNLKGAVFETFREIIELCLDQLISPYEKFKHLNMRFNKIDTKKPQEIQDKFREAYSECYPAINYIDGQDVSVVLAKALQNIFIELNK
ncbi:MAG: hypothetical protein JKY02_00960 [Flavobacteriaceae bacterium]|nr:hypothetical protein [Flavobacteriaceae bacterium]